jgi:hypothetical protein
MTSEETIQIPEAGEGILPARNSVLLILGTRCADSFVHLAKASQIFALGQMLICDAPDIHPAKIKPTGHRQLLPACRIR